MINIVIRIEEAWRESLKGLLSSCGTPEFLRKNGVVLRAFGIAPMYSETMCSNLLVLREIAKMFPQTTADVRTTDEGFCKGQHSLQSLADALESALKPIIKQHPLTEDEYYARKGRDCASSHGQYGYWNSYADVTAEFEVIVCSYSRESGRHTYFATNDTTWKKDYSSEL